MNGFYLAIGKQGSGKTLFITKLLVDNLGDRPVFSNYTLHGIAFQPVTLSDRLKREGTIYMIEKIMETSDGSSANFFNNSIILLDEIHLDLNSLDFMRKNNRILQTFFSQLRKRNILLLATSQYILNVDIRIRRQCKNVFDMYHIEGDIFQVVTNDIDGYLSEEISRHYIDLSDYYKYYDTNEIIL